METMLLPSVFNLIMMQPMFDYYAKSIKLNRSKIDYRVLDIPPDELEVDLDLMEF